MVVLLWVAEEDEMIVVVSVDTTDEELLEEVDVATQEVFGTLDVEGVSIWTMISGVVEPEVLVVMVVSVE